MKFRSKRAMALAGAAIALTLFLVRPGAGRLKSRIAGSIGTALQRQVEISKVHVRLLPQPGFDLEGFVVRDDPSFGAEPVLRCQDVIANLRISSLIRGRLEISRLSLSEPSLNLVRREDGRWNIETLLERNSGITAAPTGRHSSRPGFPYIEADRGRVNVKFGPEKKPFALTDAKYALWQDSENTWGMRLRGQPVRTDFNLSDTGQLDVEGTWERAATLRDTPLEFNLRWEGGQLGQLSKLVSGEDRGWRGTVRTALSLRGNASDLLVGADASLEDFHRYDITDSTALELKSHCSARYHIANHSLDQILCATPVGDGVLTVSGEASKLTSPSRFDVQLTAEKIPMNSMLRVIRRAKKNLPDDLRATGTMDAQLSVRTAGPLPNSIEVDGSGETSDFHLVSEGARADLALDAVPFSVGSGTPAKQVKNIRGRMDPGWLRDSQEPHLALGPVPVKLGRPSPVWLQARMVRSGYSISLKGESEIQRLLELARVSGIPAAHVGATGSAKLDLLTAGQWTGYASPVTTGIAELHGVRAQIRGVNGPLEINSARINLTDSETRVEAISASFIGTQWTGALSIPRPCVAPASCLLSLDLHADELSTDQLNHWLNPNLAQQPWYRFATTSSGGHSFLTGIRASGSLAINRAIVRKLLATRLTTRFSLDQGKLRLTELRADVLGGKHRGEWRADFTMKPPLYSGSGTLDSTSLGQLADMTGDSWISGSASAKYQVDLAGFSSAELMGSARGTLHFEMGDGALPHILVATLPLRVRRFTGMLTFRQSEFQLQDATLEAPGATYAVTGTASLNRKLDFRLVPEGSAGLMVTGTLAEPRVSPARRSETEAALKP